MEYDLADRLPLVKANASQIFQVLMNLITNAGEACLPDLQGSITIRTRGEDVEEVVAGEGNWILPVVPGTYATLEVKDTGAGMSPEILVRIFGPFFTTKFTGRGLGLATAMGIIRSHGGGLQVESGTGKGSSFKIFLPALPEANSLSTPEPCLDNGGSICGREGGACGRYQLGADGPSRDAGDGYEGHHRSCGDHPDHGLLIRPAPWASSGSSVPLRHQLGPAGSSRTAERPVFLDAPRPQAGRTCN